MTLTTTTLDAPLLSHYTTLTKVKRGVPYQITQNEHTQSSNTFCVHRGLAFARRERAFKVNLPFFLSPRRLSEALARTGGRPRLHRKYDDRTRGSKEIEVGVRNQPWAVRSGVRSERRKSWAGGGGRKVMDAWSALKGVDVQLQYLRSRHGFEEHSSSHASPKKLLRVKE
ncbi:hypothetical protein BJV74DRAFT_798343 [Russula compacta]|nr:hypothetical protein BJV74DRAFT_798343 [Russula compacta]